jgi:hypothetical protein
VLILAEKTFFIWVWGEQLILSLILLYIKEEEEMGFISASAFFLYGHNSLTLIHHQLAHKKKPTSMCYVHGTNVKPEYSSAKTVFSRAHAST